MATVLTAYVRGWISSRLPCFLLLIGLFGIFPLQVLRVITTLMWWVKDGFIVWTSSLVSFLLSFWWIGSITKQIEIFSLPLSFILQQDISMKYFLPIPTASAYRRYYCLSCLLSLWLKNVDCSLTERWSRVYSSFNRLFQEKYDYLGINCTGWQSPRKNQPVSVLYNQYNAWYELN